MMLLRKASSDALWLPIAAAQNGMISRGQLLGLGLTPSQARTNVNNGRWRRVHPGVYATFTGTIDPVQQVWAALLYAGAGAAACCSTSLWLFGVLDHPPGMVNISIPESRRVDPVPGLRLHRRRPLNRPDTPVHPAATPRRIRIEESVLDDCANCSESDAVGLILRATQRRLTTPDRISAALDARPVQSKRALIRDVLAEAKAGVASPLELHYRRRVEVPHGLPVGRRNLAEVDQRGRRRYRDVDYRKLGLIVELDGREAHPPDEAFRDLQRDNEATLDGRVVLHYGWRDVVGRPCVVAEQVGLALQKRGWTGANVRCGPACAIPPTPTPA